MHAHTHTVSKLKTLQGSYIVRDGRRGGLCTEGYPDKPCVCTYSKSTHKFGFTVYNSSDEIVCMYVVLLVGKC